MRLAVLFLLTCLTARAQSDTVIRIYFDFDGTLLRTQKNVFLKLDKTRWEPGVTLTGKADTTGNASYNDWLAGERIKAVAALLDDQDYFVLAGSNAAGERSPSVPYDAAKERCVEIGLKHSAKTDRPVQKSVSNEALKLPKGERIPRDFDPEDSLMAPGDVLVLNNIEFELNEVIITLESFPELQHLVKVMKKNPTMRIHIRGHVCCAPALELSDSRAKKIYYYLINQGINDERMTFKGYSNREPHPLYKHDLYDPHHRRVEIEILSK